MLRRQPRAQKVPRFSRRSFEAILAGLQSSLDGLKWNAAGTEWADYYEANHNYGESGLTAKERAVRELLLQVQPRTVWDLGANNGRFSRIAAQCGAETVVAWDIDPACVDQNYRDVIKQRETAIHPLLLDLANPSPGIGWAHCERASLLDRARLMPYWRCGLIHHLAVSNNVPLGEIANFFAKLAKWLVVEWVPKDDSQFQRLLNSREDIFADYSQGQFEQQFARYFSLERGVPLEGTRRTLYLMRAIDQERP